MEKTTEGTCGYYSRRRRRTTLKKQKTLRGFVMMNIAKMKSSIIERRANAGNEQARLPKKVLSIRKGIQFNGCLKHFHVYEGKQFCSGLSRLLKFQEETRCLTKARKVGVVTPVLYAVDTISHSLTFEYVEGSVKDHFHEFGLKGVGLDNTDEFALQIGNTIGKLYDGGVFHGDLTTSNMLWHYGKLVLIDFGLSFVSTLPEDKATDLYVLE
ncbi:Kae1-associated kinase Bud32 [Artemisia annua]|uniref:non-specific serine/threonine protein kinase n=1 Tax=Artemisia annua TaxID=35608 RepID=A0A2U1LP66_ARTAN|nr:Kae1-associated kinase Bud32 [Artemisia annua]